MKFLRVPPEKLKRYQHYHDDRDVAWIKLYTSLLDAEDDVDYSLLPDATKTLLHHVWMLAARTKNKIPYNREWISKQKLNVRSTINLKDLLAKGFLEILDDALESFIVPALDDSLESALDGSLVSHASLGSSFILDSDSSPKSEVSKKNPRFNFAAAWSEYPRKRGRTDAERHFRAQVKTPADFEALLSAIRNYVRECELLGTEEQFQKYGSTFFNGAWRDYVDGVWKPPSPPKPPKGTPARPSVEPSETTRKLMERK